MGDFAALQTRAGSWPQVYTLDDYVSWISGGGLAPLVRQTWQVNRESIEGNFLGLVRDAYQANGVVFACLMTRFLLLSEARFQFQQMRGGRPGDLFGTPDLQIIETPEPGKTTADLLALADLDASLGGDWIGVRRPGRIKRLRPDWTVAVIGSPNVGPETPADDPDAELAGWIYSPGGLYAPTSEPWYFTREEVAHYAPIPDPIAKYRGMPLVTAAIREIAGDSAATTHKLSFFEHAATPNMVVRFPQGLTKKRAEEWIELFEQEHNGAANAYKTIYLGAGAEADVVGKDLRQLYFKATQGAGETRIAAALGVYPTIVGLSEGLQGSSLNAGNFGAAKRLTADKTLRPAWRNLAGSLQTIVPAPAGTRLWYDDRDIPFLADDIKDKAEVLALNVQAIRTLSDGGFVPESAVDAVVANDLRRLVHSGAYSVQLQAPGDSQDLQQQARVIRSLVAEHGMSWSEAVEAVASGDVRRLADPWRSRPSVRALVTFWPSTAALPADVIERGTVLSAGDPVVQTYPSLFGPAEGVAA